MHFFFFRLECDLAELENPWNLDIMDTDDSDSNDETDYIPQFDGASDKNPGKDIPAISFHSLLI